MNVPVETLHLETELKLRIKETMKFLETCSFAHPSYTANCEALAHLTLALHHVSLTKFEYYKIKSE
jgi:hypothetical protein